MKLHWHNSAVVRAPSRLVTADGKWRGHDFPIRYGLYSHPAHGLILIDTGYSPALFASPDRHAKLYRTLLRPRLIAEGDAVAAVRKLGAGPGDVRHIVLTHLHADHMCGVDRFPKATLHASATSLAGWNGGSQFSSPYQGFFVSLLPAITERNVHAVESGKSLNLPWGGQGFDVLGDGSMISVDLPGHMAGHIGVFFPKLAQPIFHAADADWTMKSLLHGDVVTLAARAIVANVKEMKDSKAIARRAFAMGLGITLCHDSADA